MTATPDRRKPGDGKLNPVNHIVRIVVVRFPSDDQSLEAATQILKETPAPAADGTSTNPTNMFEALEPTDIVVVGRRPTSVRRITSADGKSRPELAEHDHCHTDTVLRVWTESDTVEYRCHQEFEIVQVEKAGWKIYGTPDNPFARDRGAMPYEATNERTSTIDAAGNPAFAWMWKSGKLPESANNQQYKATFRIGDQDIDPDVVCGDPPPAP